MPTLGATPRNRKRKAPETSSQEDDYGDDQSADQFWPEADDEPEIVSPRRKRGRPKGSTSKQSAKNAPAKASKKPRTTSKAVDNSNEAKAITDR